MQLSPSGSLLLTGDSDGVARVWLAASGALLRTIVCRGARAPDSGLPADGWRGRVTHAQWAPDERTLLLCTAAADAALWSEADGACAAAPSPVVVYDVASGEPLVELVEHASEVWYAKYADVVGQRTVLTVGEDGLVVRWHLVSGAAERARLQAPRLSRRCCVDKSIVGLLGFFVVDC